MVLDLIDKGKELSNEIDMYTAVSIVQVADALKMRQLVRRFITKHIMPLLNRETVIGFIKVAYNKLSTTKLQNNEEADELESQTSMGEEEELWFESFGYCLDLAAANIQYLIRSKASELHEQLEVSIIEEIIERALRFYKSDIQFDNSLLFDTLIKVRKCSSIFELLDQEKIKI